ncbi:diacylglycerol kinase family lipid kinase [Actinokineospora sp. PR83]|uniref:diacylglycerol/lipid kinase family protein n=1 Tax=Actinokineospora sp. PR83 TaxID=2884908 RepID=UPI001F1EE6C8|nr:diacylglycerol kinase family protein [Actinokineospora sp. PR83]MCG8916114.1 diacylglycerol kinase family lipid kinase [Actinokineospora sp. PR83]
MRAVLVVNPKATATTPAGRDVLASALASAVKLDVVETDYRGHAQAAAAQAAVDGAHLVVAHGGDGTVNEVVNGLLAAGPRSDTPMLGVVPGGSANVFARALGLPRNPVEATHVLLRALARERTRRVGLGRVEADGDGGAHRWFTFNAGMGWDADVVERVARKRGKKATTSLYARSALARYVRPGRGRPALTLEIPGEAPIEGLRLAFVSNTDPWTYLNSRPIRLNPGCTFEGGLGLFALRSLSVPTVLGAFRRALSTADKQHGKRLVRRDDIPGVVVTSAEPVRLQCDGDLLGERKRVVFTAVPDALTVVV